MWICNKGKDCGWQMLSNYIWAHHEKWWGKNQCKLCACLLCVCMHACMLITGKGDNSHWSLLQYFEEKSKKPEMWPFPSFLINSRALHQVWYARLSKRQFTEGRPHYWKQLIKYTPWSSQATKQRRYLKGLNAKKNLKCITKNDNMKVAEAKYQRKLFD